MSDTDVQLKNGKTAPISVVTTTMIALRRLYYDQPTLETMFAIVAMVRRLKYGDKVNFDHLKILVDFALMREDGSFQSYVPDIVESAIKGDAFINIVIGSPVPSNPPCPFAMEA